MEEINLNGQKFRIAVYNRQGNERKDLTKEVMDMIWTPEKIKHQQREWLMMGVNKTRQKVVFWKHRFKAMAYSYDNELQNNNLFLKGIEHLNKQNDKYFALCVVLFILCAFTMAGFFWALTYIPFL